MNSVSKRLLPPNRYMVYLGSFMMDFICAFIIGGTAVYAVELGAGPVQLGAIGATGAALYTVCSIISGKLSDRYNRKRSLVAYSLIGLFAVILFTRATHIAELFIYYGLFHVSIGLYWPTLQSLLADSRHGRSLSSTLGNFCLSWSLGFTVGHYICGKLTELEATTPFVWCLYLSLVTLMLCLGLSEEEGDHKSASRDFMERTVSVSRQMWRRFLVCGWIANFTLVFTLGAAKMLFPKLALDVDHLNRTVLGLMLALIHGGQFFMFALTKYWHRWQYNRGIYLATQLLALPGAALLAWSGGVAAYASAMLLIGICAGFTYASSIYYSTSRPPDSTTRTGFHEAFIGLGILLGPLAGGFVADIWNLHSPYVLALALIAVSIATQTWVLLRPLKSTQ